MIEAETAAVKPKGRQRLARDVFFEYLVQLDVRYLFGNPGTTELPLIDGCNDYPSIEYVLSLHEDVAVAQAMGYARASGKFGVVNLHVAPGVAHGLGNLYNAFRARVPLLVTAGQQHTGLAMYEPILTADLADMVRPFSKWAYEVRMAEELPVIFQRAFKELITPPYGLVFVSMPPELMLAPYDGPTPPPVSRIAPTLAAESGVQHAAKVLADAKRPMIVSGDGVGHARAWPEIEAIAEALGAPVYSEGYSTMWNFSADHPLWAGPMSNQAGPTRATFAAHDVVLLCGFTSQAPVSRYDEKGSLIPADVRIVAVDDSSWELGKNQPVEVGLLGDLKRNLTALASAVRQETTGDAAGLVARNEAARAMVSKRREAWEKKIAEARSTDALTPVLVAATLRDLLPSDAIFVDEAISNRESFVNVLNFSDPIGYYAANGLSLGYSGGVASGMKLAAPERTVVNVVGDGSFMYYPQTLWNAANLDKQLLFVVLNNGSYRVLKLIIDRMGGPWNAERLATPGLDFAKPSIDFVALASAFGVHAERVRTAAEIRPALERGLAAGKPYLVEVVLEQSSRSEKA